MAAEIKGGEADVAYGQFFRGYREGYRQSAASLRESQEEWNYADVLGCKVG